MHKYLTFLVLAYLLFFYSCKKETFLKDSNARLSFSKDTIMFDTVFTTRGSATRKLMIYNRYNSPVKISSVTLAGGIGSAFKINVDGQRDTSVVKDIELGAKDSAYIFVQVYINPTQKNAPLEVMDSIIFNLNNNIQNVKLVAWGQDVHLYKDCIIKTQTWTNDKPYLIIDSIKVESSSTLTIQEGTTIYLHKDGWFKVDGNLVINGSLSNPVTFRGDRFDNLNTTPAIPYDKLPGQWGEIWIRNSSIGSKFNYTNIRNATNGIHLGVLGQPGNAALEISNCKIENCSYSGIFAINSNLKANNTLVDNCGFYCFAAVVGGNYEFYQSTFASYSGGIAALLQNFLVYINQESNGIIDTLYFYADLSKAYFGNCIFAGDAGPEFIAGSIPKSASYKLNYTIDHCYIRGTSDELLNLRIDPGKFIGTTISDSVDPGFKSLKQYEYDFRLTSKAIYLRDKGSRDVALLYPLDYFQQNRFADDAPDLGPFEYNGTGN